MLLSVIACNSNSNFQERKFHTPNTFVTDGKATLETWLPANVSNGDELKTLCNLFSSLVSVDKYNRNFGDIFYQSNKTKTLVGDTTDYKKWTYYVNPNGIQEQEIRKWYNYKGEVIRKITVNDILNTVKYAIYPYNTSSRSSYLWDKLKGYQTIKDYYNPEINPQRKK